MAETIMLAMDQRYKDMSQGYDLPLEGVFEMERLAAETGFRAVLEKKPAKLQARLIQGNFVRNVDFGGVRI